MRISSRADKIGQPKAGPLGRPGTYVRGDDKGCFSGRPCCILKPRSRSKPIGADDTLLLGRKHRRKKGVGGKIFVIDSTGIDKRGPSYW